MSACQLCHMILNAWTENNNVFHQIGKSRKPFITHQKPLPNVVNIYENSCNPIRFEKKNMSAPNRKWGGGFEALSSRSNEIFRAYAHISRTPAILLKCIVFLHVSQSNVQSTFGKHIYSHRPHSVSNEQRLNRPVRLKDFVCENAYCVGP